jgi:Leucine-rich repeat (LRR) protein
LIKGGKRMAKYDCVPDKNEIVSRIEAAALRDRLAGGKSGDLQVLDLSNLNMTELPAEIESLENLVGLNVSSNQWEILPDWIGDLTGL